MSRIGRALGPPSARWRRHRRFALGAVLLLLLAGALVVLGGDDSDDGFADAARSTCRSFGERVQDEFALTFPEGPPTEAAQAEYLARAFADTMEQLVDELRALEPSGDAALAVEALATRIQEIRDDPDAVVAAGANPFADDVAPRFDDLDLAACGSEFFPAPE